MSEDVDLTKTIIYLVHYLKDVLKKGGGKLSDARLAVLLNEVQPTHQPSVWFDTNKLHLIRTGKAQLNPDDQSRILSALRSLAESNDLRAHETNIASQYASKLPARLREISVQTPFQGDQLGAVAEFLAGAWYFFYVSPINRKGQFKPEIRRTAAVFQRTDGNEHSLNVLLISGHGQWKGFAFVNDTHLYISCTDDRKTETAFFVTNRPKKVEKIIVGVGTAQARIDLHSIRPVAGIFCFGEKWEPATSSSLFNIDDSIARAIKGEPISASDEATIRKLFCVTYDDTAEMQKQHPILHRYLQRRISVNGRPGLSLDSLYVAWN